MTAAAIVDVNLIVHNSALTVGLAIESVLSQTWPALRLTVIDDGSTDHTAQVASHYAEQDARVSVKRNRCNGGAVANFQRAFWLGNADFVMPKSGDDVLAPTFIAELMELLLTNPDCAMCHAAGLIFHDDQIEREYPLAHRLHAVDPDPCVRARYVMTRYTSSPSFWGIYRRAAVDRTSRIYGGAGWDHVFLAEIALAGEIRHVPELLYWRRDGGKPVLHLARAATQQAQNGLSPDDELGDQLWRVPLITTAWQHIRMLATARLPLQSRRELIAEVPEIFRRRWFPLMQHEAEQFRLQLPGLLDNLSGVPTADARWQLHQLMRVQEACATIMPEIAMPSIPAGLELAA